MKKKKRVELSLQESRKEETESYTPPRLTRYGKLKEHTVIKMKPMMGGDFMGQASI